MLARRIEAIEDTLTQHPMIERVVVSLSAPGENDLRPERSVDPA